MLYLKLFVHLSMTWIILLWIFQGYSLFSYQCSLLFSATLICYHIQQCLSTTFLFCFSALSSWCVVVFDSFDILSSCLSFVKNFFSFFISNVSVLCDSLFILSNCFVFVNNFFHLIFRMVECLSRFRFSFFKSDDRIYIACGETYTNIISQHCQYTFFIFLTYISHKFYL